MFFALLLGVPLGFVAAKRYGTWVDHASLVVSLLGISIPVFFLAILLKYVFAVKLGWLPTVGRISATIDLEHPTNFYLLDAILAGELGGVLGRDQAPDPARDRARHDPARDHRPHHPRVRARRPERGLRAHRPREGPLSAGRRRAAHLPERAAADRHDHRPPDGPAAVGRGADRDCFRLAGHGHVARGGDQGAQLPGAPGRDPLRRRSSSCSST